MLPAVRRTALAAASRVPCGQRTAAAAAAIVTSMRALSGGGGGMVAGQDTPVSLEDLPDNVKAQFEATEQAPGAKEDDQQASSSGAGDGQQQEGEAGRHPGPQQDPYSGGDPTQGGKE